MATRKQKEELFATLKFTPRTYCIDISGYGGEIVLGTVNNETFEYFKKHNIDVEDYIGDWDNELDIPDEHNFAPDGGWYECSDVAHESGVEMDSACVVTVYDENDNEVWSSNLSITNLDDIGCQLEEENEVYVGEQPIGSVIFTGQSCEKGTFFNGKFKIISPFDPKKLKFNYCDIDGWVLNSSIEYDGESIDNTDYSTTGKSCAYSLTLIEKDGIKVYKHGEDDGMLGSNYYPDDSELSPEFPSSTNPAHIGWYRCTWGNKYSTSSGQLYWDGNHWITFQYKKPVDVDGVDSWQGLNWDTSKEKV